MGDNKTVRTIDPEITELETTDGEVIDDYDRPNTPVATDVHRVTFRDATGTEHTVSEGDTFIDADGRTVGTVTRIRAAERYGGGVNHYVYIDYGAGDYDATNEGGCPLGEIAAQLAANDMTTRR